MKKTKKIAALLAAVILVVTAFSGVIPANAAGQLETATLVCGSYTAKALLNSVNKRNGYATTQASDGKTKFNSLYAQIFGARVDKNNNVRYVNSDPITKSNVTTTGIVPIQMIPISSSDYYKNLSSGHIAIKGSYEKSTSLAVHY